MWAPDPSESRGVDVGELLREYRHAQVPRLTQARLAEFLNVDQSLISKIESGKQQVRTIDFLLRISERLGIDRRRLGLLPELERAIQPERHEHAYEAAARASQVQWMRVREHMNGHRAQLARRAAALHEETNSARVNADHRA